MTGEKPKLKDLLEIAEKIKDKDLREKTIDFLKEPKLSTNWDYKASDFDKIPAWIEDHHNFEGGLLVHTISVTEICIKLAEHFKKTYNKKINLDFLISGSILHDIAKVFEIKKQGETLSFNNFILDHVRLGAAELYARGFPEEVVHIVGAHAGGDTPRTIEAIILDVADSLDTRIENFGKENSLIYLLGESLK
ncbi:MAG: HDIG domain-containing protein [Candidatus Aenigmarchaeota archaeon]|nr:HDIG domain-containing protein [Candidatus Aenigmarchaeota archaeon]